MLLPPQKISHAFYILSTQQLQYDIPIDVMVHSDIF